MELIIGLIVIIIFFSPLISLLSLRSRLKKLEEDNIRIRKRLDFLESDQPFDAGQPFEAEQPLVESTFKEETVQAVEKKEVLNTSGQAEELWQKESTSPSEGRLRQKKKPSARRALLEKKFLENWTGILGAVIVVLGAGFLSLYAAVNLNEFARFMLLLLLAAIPAVLYYLLKGKEKWHRQALWLRSISGAVFLFACLGSGGLPGLTWIQNPLLSLALLTAGILVNLWLGSLGGRQYFASFHTLLSLIALSVMPPGSASLFMALVICLFAVFQTYKSLWDKHLLITITAFFLFHLRWMHQLKTAGMNALLLESAGMDTLLRYQGSAVVLILFITAALIHYRKNYSTGRFDLIPFLVHLANWLYFAVAMILYTGEYNWRTLPLLLASLICFLLSRLAEKKNIRWLKITDMILFQALFISALLTLTGWDVNLPLVSGLIFAEIILFVRIMIMNNEYFLFRTGINLSYLSAAFILAVSAGKSDYSNVLITGAAAVMALWVHRVMYSMSDAKWTEGDTLPGLAKRVKDFALTPLSAALLSIVSTGILLDLNNSWYSMPSAALLLCTFLLFYLKSPGRSLGYSGMLYLSLYSLAGWVLLFSKNSALFHLSTGIALVMTGSLSWFVHRKRHRNSLISSMNQILTVIGVIIASWALLNPLSPWLPGIFWLGMVVVSTALKRISTPLKVICLLFPAAYCARHFAVHIHLDDALGRLPVRYIMDIIILPVLYFIYRKKEALTLFGQRKVMPLLQEIMLLFTVAVLLIEVQFIWTGPVLMLLSLITLAAGIQEDKNSRFTGYSFLLYLISLILAQFSVAAYFKTGISSLPGVLTILMGAGFCTLFYLKAGSIISETAVGHKIFTRPAFLFNRDKASYLVYPLFSAAALFILLAFHSEIHTLLWAVECFVLFTVSLMIKKESFRYISQAGMLICVGRLVLFDLSGSSVFLRGIVFLGVGTLLLGINAMYLRFKKEKNSK